MTEDGDGTIAEAERRRSRTNPEKRRVPNPNIKETHASPLKNIFSNFHFGFMYAREEHMDYRDEMMDSLVGAMRDYLAAQV